MYYIMYELYFLYLYVDIVLYISTLHLCSPIKIAIFVM